MVLGVRGWGWTSVSGEVMEIARDEVRRICARRVKIRWRLYILGKKISKSTAIGGSEKQH